MKKLTKRQMELRESIFLTILLITSIMTGFLSSKYQEEVKLNNDSLVAIMELEKSGIEPFASCKVLSRPKSIYDFDLNGYDNSARYYSPIGFLSIEEEPIKEYMSCVAFYGALVAQHIKTNSFTPELKDKELKQRFESFFKRLETDKCRFSGSVDSILCGGSELKISANPNVSFGDIVLYSNQNFYGYTLNSQSEPKSINQNKDLSDSLNKSSKANLSLSKFLPGG